MAVYRTVEDLEQNILEKKDVVYFMGIRYVTAENALLHYLDDNNDKIFIVLGIKDKYEFCKDHYGYPPTGSRLVPEQFPTTKDFDYKALTRVAIALMKHHEKK